MYNLCKINVNNKKLLKELLLDISGAAEELLEELTTFVANLNLI